MSNDIQKELETIQLRLKAVSLTINRELVSNPKDEALLRECYEVLAKECKIKPVCLIGRLMDRLDML